MEYKSQIGQDEWVCRSLNNKCNGYFIDIGANDGISFSNTYVLEKTLGWDGLCIEPSREQFELLEKGRNCFCINKAIYVKNGSVKFKEENKFFGKISDEGYKVECITFDELLKQYKCPAIIDYISIDIEGLEYEILKKFPFSDFKVRLWTIEYHDEISKDKIRELMTANGYLFESVKFEDWFYLS